MIIAVVITVIVAIAIALVVAVGRDPGPAPVDVAIGYARALGAGDFDAVYRMLDPDVLRGRNRVAWIEAERGRPPVAWSPNAVVAVAPARVAGDDALVEIGVGAAQPMTIGLVRRQRIWTVASVDGVAVSADAE